MSCRRLVFYTGLPPGDTGTGQLVEWLRRQGARVVFAVEPGDSPRALLRAGRVPTAIREAVVPRLTKLVFRLRLWLEGLFNNHEVVLLHPQTIGTRRVLDFVRRRRLPPYLFLLDSGYFCVRSYNHLPGETKPCLRCLGGHFDAIREHRCEPFPVPDDYAESYVRELWETAKKGRLRVVAQCETQARLARQHFGIDIPVAGLWTADWDGLFDVAPMKPTGSNRMSDVVFHGLWLEAKGASWLLEVAKRCPDLGFLFPFQRPPSEDVVPSNCDFSPMSWESGLARAAAEARIVIAPSLWSAPVESAVVKSIVTARAAAIVENATAFASEIPDDVALRLSRDPKLAAEQLTEAVRKGWQPNQESRAKFLASFRKRNENLLREVWEVVARFDREETQPEMDRRGERR